MQSKKLDLKKFLDPSKVHVPTDLARALAESKSAQKTWSTVTPHARRDWILWIVSGKKAETRGERIKKACSMLSSGKKRVCCFGGVKWLMKVENESR